MSSSNSLLQSLSSYSDTNDKLPPVEQWDPEYCGDMALLLKANGQWIYNDAPFGRKKMQYLFSKILKKEKEQYYLVSPVEKIGIQVEWQPFVITDFEITQYQDEQHFIFTDNCDNKIVLEDPQQIQFSDYQGESLPIVKVRRNLYASFNRSCYYRLIEQAQIIKHPQHDQVQISSGGINYSLGIIHH